MMRLIARYTRWLHTRWPAGTVEPLPEVNADGTTAVPGLYVVGDLTGVPLLKFAADSGARAASKIADEIQQRGGLDAWRRATGDEARFAGEVLDLAIIGGGVAGMAAALEAKKHGLSFVVLEAAEPFSTIANFPKAKPIFTYPTDMTPAGSLQFTARSNVKEGLLDELRELAANAGITPRIARVERITRQQGLLHLHLTPAPAATATSASPPPDINHQASDTLPARRVIVAIGRSGNFRKLGVPGEELPHVSNRLHDPHDFKGKDVLVVGGGDSAIESAIALAQAGARVTLCHRRPEFTRPKPENLERLNLLSGMASTAGSSAAAPGDHRHGAIRVRLGATVDRIGEREVALRGRAAETIAADAVFVLIGREPPLEFFRRSGVRIRGEWHAGKWIALILFFLFCVLLYHFKSNHPHELPIQQWVRERGWFPYSLPGLFDWWSQAAARRGHLLYTLKDSMAKPSFYYTLAYCVCVVGFGIRRMRRRRTPYVTVQTLTLMAVQCVPLFILPEIVLPWMGRNEMFIHGGPLQWLADRLFEPYDGIGIERAYWRAYGFILAFPLNVYNVFTPSPMWLWLVISALQTLVIIPLIIWRWGKGAYCGWICSCGALAETMGDAHRQKMPHGPIWNRLNMLGQAVLLFALLLLGLRVAGWSLGAASWPARGHEALFHGIPFLNYAWSVDIFLGGLIGVGAYFWFSGRVWCRFACPLAALMHIYARFSRFRIFADKKKCISCNVCTSVCHQGIDVMGFANKGEAMADPQCVRCSACVQSCPTGVLEFGRVDGQGRVAGVDRLRASPVRMVEVRVNGHATTR